MASHSKRSRCALPGAWFYRQVQLARATTGDGLAAAAWAGALSGLPSTAHAVATNGDPLEAARAAGSVLLPGERSSSRLLIAAFPVHVAMSTVWGIALAYGLPRRRTIEAGAVAGLVIAAIDLGAAARWWPRIRALPQVAQVADHVAFGAIAAYVIARRRAGREQAEGREAR
jgi:hypothetical protein